MQTRLYRSRTDSMIGGVCGGLAHYLVVDPTVVRLFFVLFALVDGPAVLIYLALWIILPLEGSPASSEPLRSGIQEMASRMQAVGRGVTGRGPRQQSRPGALIGMLLIAGGALFLFRNMHFAWVSWMNSDLLRPVALSCSAWPTHAPSCS